LWRRHLAWGSLAVSPRDARTHARAAAAAAATAFWACLPLSRGVGVATDPLVLEPRGRIQYFEQHQQVSIMRMIMGNPTVLMMGVMGVMCYALPKMMENMDPEELKKMQVRTQHDPDMFVAHPSLTLSSECRRRR
jgi:hypothetical protein